MTQQTTRRYGRWLARLGLAAAAALAGYGIWSRQASVAYLQQTADDAALPRVQVVLPKEGLPTQALTLPGEVKAWNEAAIYGQVSGYVSQWFKDYGAHVNAPRDVPGAGRLLMSRSCASSSMYLKTSAPC